MKCIRCGRHLTREPVNGFGPTCLRAVLGAKPPQVKRENRRSADERQLELLEAACPTS